MTGYGRAREIIDGRDITVEIKSVNHRYCEMFVRIPRSYMQIEDNIRTHLQKQIIRGKVEVSINIGSTDAEGVNLKLNEGLLKEYVDVLSIAADKFNLENDVTATTILRLPDVLNMDKEETDMEAVWNDIKSVTDKALTSFIAQREKEGAFLANDIMNKCDDIVENVEFIKTRCPELVPIYIEKLKTRIKQLTEDKNVDEQRLLTEAAIMADKMAVDEEMVRLASHVQNLRSLFVKGLEDNSSAVPLGKKMDFFIQEMNREINTVSSKIGDMEITIKAIEVKNIIEKIREQVQNIE